MPRREFDSDLDEPPRRRQRRPRKEKSSNPTLILVCVGIGFLFLVVLSVGGYFLLRAKSPAVGSDLDRLAGRWECTFRDGTGRITMHKVKEISGTTETATWYRADGSVFRVNRVEFALIVRGNSKVFSYFNGTVIDDRGIVQHFPPGEYVYTLEGDIWAEFPIGEPVIVWTRSK